MDSMTDVTEQAPDIELPQERPPALEALLMGAVDIARGAVEELSGADTVGEYLGAVFDDQTAATHRFLAVLPG